MKKIILNILLVGFVGLIFTQAQTKDPKAKVILDKVSAYYKTVNSFKATFELGVHTAQAGMNKTQNGYLIYKGGKFIVDKGDGSTIYTDGKTVWDYYNEDDANELTINNYDEQEMGQLSIQKVADTYKEGYKYILKGESKINGVICNEIDLDPDLSPEEHSRNSVFKIKIFSNKATNRIVRWEIFQKNGDRFTVTLTSFDSTYVVADKDFVFDKNKYPGIIVEDWR